MSLESYDSIFEEFSATSPEDWKNKIIKDLKGDEFEKLIWHTKDDIEVLPFYTKEDNLIYQLNIPEKQSENWLITERITVNDFLLANQKALFSLQNGANAIVFDLLHQSATIEQIQILIKNILSDIAKVTFENYLEDYRYILEQIVKNSCPKTIKIPQFDSITDELVFALQQSLNTAAMPTYFHFYITQNYFFEIAKLRAFRWLWKQICILNKQQYNVTIQSETGFHNRNGKDEYTNILRNTTEAMSAILGGCDSLIINSHDAFNAITSNKAENTDFGKRIARNIHHILQCESYFSEINDAVKGTYYIEYLTYQFAKKSWEKFTIL